MFTARGNTTLVSPSGATSIEDFFNSLVSSSLTAEDLVVGSHASDEGFLFLALDSSHTALPIKFEDLQAVQTSGTIKIPASVRGPDTKFHVKGCAIGSDDSLPFLTLLKQVLDNPAQVTAPKFFHGLYEFTRVGIFEFMGNDFRIVSKDAFPTRAALVAAFQAAGLTLLDGSAVPAADIDKWVKRTLQLKPAVSHKVPFSFPVKIVPAVGSRSAIDNLQAQCRSKAEQYTYSLDTGSAPPADPAARLAAMKTSLSAEPDQQSTHDYPIYARLHYASFDDFFDRQKWRVTLSGTVQNWVGTHFVYTLVIPIVKPATTDELIFNYYPFSGGAPVINFAEDNANFTLFGQV